MIKFYDINYYVNEYNKKNTLEQIDGRTYILKNITPDEFERGFTSVHLENIMHKETNTGYKIKKNDFITLYWLF